MAYSRPGVYLTETLLPAPLPGGASANAAGAVVAPLAGGPEAVTLVTSWYEFTNKFGGYNATYPATFQIGSYFANGGKELYVKRVLHTDAVAAHVNLLTSASATVATVTSKNAGTDGNNLIVVLTAGTVASTYTLTLYKENVAGNILLERYENIVFNDSTATDFAETVVNTVSSYISISASASGTPVLTTYPLTSGSNGATVTATDYTSYKGSGNSAFEGFSVVNRPLVIFLPEINEISGATDVYNAAIDWAENNGGFVVAETPKATTIAADANTYAGELTASSNVAVYHPHLYVVDPVGRVVLENAFVFNPPVLKVFYTVVSVVGDDAIPFVFCKILRRKDEIDMVGSLSEVGSGRVHCAEIEAQIKTPVDIPAEYGMEVLFFQRSLSIGDFRECFIDPVVFNAIILVKVWIHRMQPVVEAIFPQEGIW